MTRRLSTDERGVILIQVGLALVVLLGFCAFAIDYGVLWVARAQAQNAADAGALAAATSLAFDDMALVSLHAEEKARRSATGIASNAVIWGQRAVVDTADVTVCDPFVDACPTVSGAPDPEARTFFSATVRVYRGAEHGNPLPTYFARLFGVETQRVRAQATADVAPVNVATCVWPLAIPDLWRETPGHEPENPPTFRRYLYPDGPETKVEFPAEYHAPSTDSQDTTPTGYELKEVEPELNPTVDRLSLVNLVVGPATPTLVDPWPAIDTSHAVAVRIGDGGFQDSLESCNRTPLRLGDTLGVDVAATFAQATSGASDRISQDAAATWNGTAFRIGDSCAATNPPCAVISPRLVLLPMFDPERYDRTRGGAPECNGLPCIEIVNFIGFFIDSETEPSQLVGHLTTYPGTTIETGTGKRFVGYKWAFLRTAVLVR